MNYPISEIARYIGISSILKGLSISPLKLQKLLYYVQSWYMAFHGRDKQIFSDIPQAWVNGPVYPSIYYAYKDKVGNMCDHLQMDDFTHDNPTKVLEKIVEKYPLDYELIESIILLYGSKTQNELILLTHSEKPWVEQREGLAPFVRSDRELSLDTMYLYYKERHERNQNKTK